MEKTVNPATLAIPDASELQAESLAAAKATTQEQYRLIESAFKECPNPQAGFQVHSQTPFTAEVLDTLHQKGYGYRYQYDSRKGAVLWVLPTTCDSQYSIRSLLDDELFSFFPRWRLL